MRQTHSSLIIPSSSVDENKCKECSTRGIDKKAAKDDDAEIDKECGINKFLNLWESYIYIKRRYMENYWRYYEKNL